MFKIKDVVLTPRNVVGVVEGFHKDGVVTFALLRVVGSQRSGNVLPENRKEGQSGGGVRGGTTFGRTDPFSYNIAENPVHIHDLHATILHLMGLDHDQLTYRYSGRDFRLTDVHGNVVKELLA